MPPIHKIAVIQLHVKPLDPETNHSRAVEFIRDAASQGCYLAVLPEYHLTGWVPDDEKFVELCGHWEKYLDAYCALAKELKMNIVPGTIIEVHESTPSSNPPLLLNTAHFISTTGSILSTYTKKNLWHPERPHLTSSTHDPHVAFDTPLGKVGMLICWDLAFPEAFRELVAGGAKMVILPTFWRMDDVDERGRKWNKDSESVFLENMLVARAFEGTCAVVFCNAGGPPPTTFSNKSDEEEKRDDVWAGLSQVSVPFKGAMGKLGSREGMSVVELDMQILEDAEENYKVRADLGSVGWHYEYSLTRDAK